MSTLFRQNQSRGREYRHNILSRRQNPQKTFWRFTMNNNCLCGLFNNNECLIWVIIAILVVLALTCNSGCGASYNHGCGCGC